MKSKSSNLFELSGLPEESRQTSTFPPYGVSKLTQFVLLTLAYSLRCSDVVEVFYTIY